MSAVASDVHNEVVRLLADGQWHDYHEILGKAAKTVQPGAAIRACERNRRLRSSTDKPRTRPLSTSEQIRTGARQIVQAVLNNRAFEMNPPGVLPRNTRKQVRLRPLSEYGRNPSNQSPALKAGLAALAGGQWHDLEQVLKIMAVEVPDEVALKQVVAADVSVGARRVAYKTLVNNKVVELDRTSEPKRVRIKPTAPQ